MTPHARTHQFDSSKARRFAPLTEHTKTAILVELTHDDAITVVLTPFGEQTLSGSFYVVAEGDASYGAARAEFEQTHERVGPCLWRKSATVLAYQADEVCVIETHVAGRHEASVTARPGDWIVQQAPGEVMVIRPEAFESRYAEVRRRRVARGGRSSSR